MGLTLKEQFELPLVQDLLEENKRITSNLSTKLPDSKIEDLKVPHTFENKLLMSEGEFNGVNYSKDEIIDKYSEAEGAQLYLDHKDTDGEGTSNWVGIIKNPHWDTLAQGEGMYGDLVISDKPTAQKLAAGAKWGVSPTIDFERTENEDGVDASDLNWKSFSLVTSPAIRATMLNKKMGCKMPEDKEKDKKLPYKYPKKGAKKDDVEMQQTDVSQDALTLLEERDTQITELEKTNKELSEKLEKFETVAKTELVSNLTANEFLIGRLEADELEDREKKLLEKSPEILTELSDMVGDHAELQSYRQFVKTFLKKNKGKSIKDAAAAWKKQGKGKDDKGKGKLDQPEDEPATDKKETSTLQEASLTTQDTEENRELSELSKHHQASEADVGMLEFMTGGAK